MAVKQAVHDSNRRRSNVRGPFQEVVFAVLEIVLMFRSHVLFYINRIRIMVFPNVGSNQLILVEDLNYLVRRTDINNFPDQTIGDRVLAISDGYEIIGLYGSR